MEKLKAINIMSALAQPTRLEVYRLLVRAGADGVSSGDLATQAGAAPNTMSSHLAILDRAGLVTARRVGRSIVYHAVPGTMRPLADYLLTELCDASCEPLGGSASAPRNVDNPK